MKNPSKKEIEWGIVLCTLGTLFLDVLKDNKFRDNYRSEDYYKDIIKELKKKLKDFMEQNGNARS